MFRSVIPSHQNKPCFLAVLFGGQSSPHTCCFRPRFHFTPLPGLPRLWCVIVAVSQVLLHLPLSWCFHHSLADRGPGYSGPARPQSPCFHILSLLAQGHGATFQLSRAFGPHAFVVRRVSPCVQCAVHRPASLSE